MCGLIFVGWGTDKFGSRKMYMLGMALLCCTSMCTSCRYKNEDLADTISLYARLRPKPSYVTDGQHAVRLPMGYV